MLEDGVVELEQNDEKDGDEDELGEEEALVEDVGDAHGAERESEEEYDDEEGDGCDYPKH